MSSSSAQPGVSKGVAPPTPTAHAERRALLATLRDVTPDLVFGLLVVIDTVRLFRHVMWRDEFQAFMLAAASSTPARSLRQAEI